MRGLVYPLSLKGGNLAVTSDYPSLVKQAIYSGLYTQDQERVFRPDYGVEPQEFKSTTDLIDILKAVKDKIRIALETYECDFELRGAITEDGRLDIVVVYQVSDFAPESIQVTL